LVELARVWLSDANVLVRERILGIPAGTPPIDRGAIRARLG
jgi:hypothetical protein